MLSHRCTTARARVAFWPGSLQWRVSGADALMVEEALLQPVQRPGLPAEPAMAAPPSPQPQPQPQPPSVLACSSDVVACSSPRLDLGRSDGGHHACSDMAAACSMLTGPAPCRRPSERRPGYEPPARKRRVTGKRPPAALYARSCPSPAPCVGVPPGEGDWEDPGLRRTAAAPTDPLGAGRGSRGPDPRARTLLVATGTNGGRPEAPLLGPCAPRQPAPSVAAHLPTAADPDRGRT